MNRSYLVASVVLSAVVASSLMAEVFSSGDVKVEGVHLCCGKCVTGAKKSLTGLEGISKVRVNKSEESVVFVASNKESAVKGLKALAQAGFYGKPSIDGPKFDVDASARKDAVSLSEMHLCCGGCVRSAVEAIESVDGVKEATANAAEGKIAVSGSGISLAAVMQALHAAGFHGTVK